MKLGNTFHVAVLLCHALLFSLYLSDPTFLPVASERGTGALDETLRTSAREAILPANKAVSTVRREIADTGSERAFSDSRAQL